MTESHRRSPEPLCLFPLVVGLQEKGADADVGLEGGRWMEKQLLCLCRVTYHR